MVVQAAHQAGWSQGEDWAEKITSDLAVLLGLPAATVELAVRAGRRGSLSLSLRPAGWELQHGALLLGEPLPGYESRSKARSGHDLDNIERVLADVLLSYVHTVRSTAEPSLTVVGTNGPDVPPAYRLLVQLRGTVAEGYQPFDGPEWTLATEVAAV